MRELNDKLDKLITIGETQITATKELTKAITTRGTLLIVVVCVIALGRTGVDALKQFISSDPRAAAESHK